MIKKLKIKFIILSMTALLALLIVIVVGMNIVNYTSVASEADEILDLLSKNKGTFPGFESGEEFPTKPEEPASGQGGRLPQHMSPELPYESRYFSVLLDGDGEVVYSDTSRIASVDGANAEKYAKLALDSGKDSGFTEDFRYVKSAEGENVRITFLDWGRKLDSFRTFLYTSIFIALAGFAVVFLVICFFAGKIIRPIAESYEKQKRFITDAGHEMKTPLTVIKANVDILEMELGRNESLSDVRQQAERLTSLTNNLVYLARMDESGENLPMIDFPISEVVKDTAASFNILARSDEKSFLCEVSPMLSIKGNAKAISGLVSILMDNALKYSDAGGRIELKLYKQNRSVILSVFNTTSVNISRDDIDRVFDRFYRTDQSRNSQTGGHGIGLSIARSIVAAHGGKISASTEDGRAFKVTAAFPL